jgi:hypothetical protein
MGKCIARLVLVAAATAAALTLALTPPMAGAAQTWFTVRLPSNIDMTWCEPAGCAGRRALPPSSLAINNAITEVVAVPTDPTDPYRHASIVSYGYGSFAATQAVYALQSSAAGQTWPGYNELPPDPTVVGIIMLRNPSRPNGGALARVAPAAALFGINTVTPPSTNNPLEPVPVPTDERLLTSFIDVAREYDGLTGFPVTANPFSIANAVAGAIFLRDYSSAWPVELHPGGVTEGGFAYLAPAPDRTVYYTQFTKDLPLLEPVRLTERFLRSIAGLPVRTPIADAFQPALTILVNIGYSDVQTPSEGGTYNRMLDQMHVRKPFMSTSPLTAQEWARVPVDVLNALAQGNHDAFGGSAAGPSAPATAAVDTPTTATDDIAKSTPPKASTGDKPKKRPLTNVVRDVQNAFAPTTFAGDSDATHEESGTPTTDTADPDVTNTQATGDSTESTSDPAASADDRGDSTS